MVTLRTEDNRYGNYNRSYDRISGTMPKAFRRDKGIFHMQALHGAFETALQST
ncbi:unnamed protein product [Nezara viridula]|uniref:Uncharacterized protein n=1 Tax=Nezara viridula TaxID=85310 RepID=A0A9P0HFL2_NEZVI|nr:unnamed protein product [Nezara viridula]